MLDAVLNTSATHRRYEETVAVYYKQRYDANNIFSETKQFQVKFLLAYLWYQYCAVP